MTDPRTVTVRELLQERRALETRIAGFVQGVLNDFHLSTGVVISGVSVHVMPVRQMGRSSLSRVVVESVSASLDLE
jgi:hypothetical protein